MREIDVSTNFIADVIESMTEDEVELYIKDNITCNENYYKKTSENIFSTIKNVLRIENEGSLDYITLESPTEWSEKKQNECLREISQWLGKEHNYNRFLPISIRNMFDSIENSRRLLLIKYRVFPIITNDEKYLEKDISIFCNIIDSFKGKHNRQGANYWHLYCRAIVLLSYQRLEIKYPNVCSKNEVHIKQWLLEISRIPIKNEIIKITKSHILYNGSTARNKFDHIKSQSILYAQAMFIRSLGKKLIFSGYTIENNSLHWHCGNWESRKGFFSEIYAKQVYSLLKKNKYINTSYYLDVSKCTIVIPYILFCARSETQIIIFGIDLSLGKIAKEIGIELVTISGFNYSKTETIALSDSTVGNVIARKHINKNDNSGVTNHLNKMIEDNIDNNEWFEARETNLEQFMDGVLYENI